MKCPKTLCHQQHPQKGYFVKDSVGRNEYFDYFKICTAICLVILSQYRP